MVFSQLNALAIADTSNYLGVKASNISGYGLYLSRDLSENFRAQIMGIIYYYEMTKNDESEKILNYDIGIELQKSMYSNDRMRTYILFGGYYYFDDETLKNVESTNVVNNSFNVGLGIGMEFSHKRIVYNFDIGYKFFEDDIDTFKDGDFSYNELKRVTKIGAGVGLGFIF